MYGGGGKGEGGGLGGHRARDCAWATMLTAIKRAGGGGEASRRVTRQRKVSTRMAIVDEGTRNQVWLAWHVLGYVCCRVWVQVWGLP